MVRGILVESSGPPAVLGEACLIDIPRKNRTIEAEVVGIEGATLRLMSCDSLEGIECGCRVVASGKPAGTVVSDSLLGQVIDAAGKPLDGKPPCGMMSRQDGEYRPLRASPPDPLSRSRIENRFQTGIKAVDGLVPVGKGQRIGIFAGSGIGKSTLLGMFARGGRADVNVIALIGERGREVREFIEKELGPESLARSIVVVSTSDTPALSRIRGALLATTIAEYFRDRGLDVLLLFDSLTRLATAQREVGLAAGEPAAVRGFPPSVFDFLPRLLERAGTSDRGSITGIYTVLEEGDDHAGPVPDALRSLLDGHIVLSRHLAECGHYPAIDVLKSVSRVENAIVGREDLGLMKRVRKALAVYERYADMIAVGAYVHGSNPEIDEAMRLKPLIDAFLVQDREQCFSLDSVQREMVSIFVHKEVNKEMKP